MDADKATQIKTIVAEVIGFEAKDISDEDKFIADYKITYTERKALLEKLNALFGKDVAFDDFCKLHTVGSVIETFTGSTVEKQD